MRYLSVAETAKKWDISERSVRNYCAHGRVPGAFLTGKTWNVPEDATKPLRANQKENKPKTLLSILQEEKKSKYSGGIYHKTQIDLTYNSNHMEGSRLTHDQTRYIFETNTIGVENEILNVDDVIDSIFKYLPYGPEDVADEMKSLLAEYNGKEKKTFENILDFHVKFEKIHPFQDGNGRVGRLIMFKECLKYNIVPFIIDDNLKLFYYRGLKEWSNEKGYLTDTCLTAQDKYKAYLDYFRIKYKEDENDR